MARKPGMVIAPRHGAPATAHPRARRDFGLPGGRQALPASAFQIPNPAFTESPFTNVSIPLEPVDGRHPDRARTARLSG
ncbi:MAG: hypothetical protein GXO78_04850 [Calditrichaeota bacterium]|nr:hypothetical protein [Calditrichota bacterium]